MVLIKQDRFGGALPGEAGASALAKQGDRLETLQRNLGADPSPASGAGETTLDPLNEETWELLRNWQPHEQTSERSTCVAFAVLAMVEFKRRLATGTGDFPDYSEEFLYSKMRRKHLPDPPPPNWEDGSTFMEQAADALETWGVCEQATMPYNQETKEPAHLEIPTRAMKAAALDRRYDADSFEYFRLYRKNADAWRDVRLVDLIRTELQAGNPVSVSFPIYEQDNQWSHPASSGWRYGYVTDPMHHAHVADCYEEAVGGHAVCITGFRSDAANPEGRFFFRNSWGDRFAWDYERTEGDVYAPPRPGYGTISAAHVENHCWELMFEKRG